MLKYILTFILTSLLTVNAYSQTPPSCDAAVKQAQTEAEKAGLQSLGYQKVPGGLVFLWANQQGTVALALTQKPVERSKVFKPIGQCMTPNGSAAFMSIASIKNEEA